MICYLLYEIQQIVILLSTHYQILNKSVSYNTVPIETEEGLINTLLTQYNNPTKKIIIYGKNSTDATVDKKHKQLFSLGLTEVYVYSGGLFEWMLLQDIYGDTEFPTTKKVLDILRYKPTPTIYKQN